MVSRKIIGTVIEFPKRKDAERHLANLRADINEGTAFAPMNLEQLAIHFKQFEAPLKSFSTREGYKRMLDNQVIPTWGGCSLAAIRSIEVENWLRKLSRKDGKPASPATKSKIRNVMSAIFSHAIRYGWASHNPITAVRTSAKRLREPEILTPEEFQGLLGQLEQRERLLVLLAGTTGLRRGELIALRWEDIDFAKQVVNVTHAIWHNVEGETKTPASRIACSSPASRHSCAQHLAGNFALPLGQGLLVPFNPKEREAALTTGDGLATPYPPRTNPAGHNQEDRLAQFPARLFQSAAGQ